MNPMVVEEKRLAEEKNDLGNQCYKEKNFDSAIVHYTNAIKCYPHNAKYCSNRSAANMMSKKFSEALEDCKTALKVDPTFTKVYLREAKCYIALGKGQEALLSLDKAKDVGAISDSDEMAERRRAEALIDFEEKAKQAAAKKDHKQVELWWRKAAKLAPACTQLQIEIARTLTLQGKYEEAQNISEDLLRKDKINVDAIFVQGLCFYYDDDIEKARTLFIRALKLSPDQREIADTLKKAKKLASKKDEGNEAFRKGRTSDAYQLYSEALEIDPNNRKTNAKLFCNRALVGGKLGKWEKALEDCNFAIDLDEKYVKAYQRRANCYTRLGQYEEALEDYQKVHQMDPNTGNEKAVKDAETLLKRGKLQDFYKTLGVVNNASDDEINKAYRKKALFYHPNRYAKATEEDKKEADKMFRKVGEAYAILSDKQKRDRYGKRMEVDEDFLRRLKPLDTFFQFFNGGRNPFNLNESTELDESCKDFMFNFG